MRAASIRVSRQWLARREPADAEARARDLAERLARDARARAGWVIHDLGCGTGAMGRWLAPLLPGPQRWVLHDRDTELLAVAASERIGPAANDAVVTLETKRSDVTRLKTADLDGADLITASALLDILSHEEVAGLLGVCAEAGCPLLLTLSVAGRVTLTPPDPLDRRLAAAFDAHQRRVTARGPLLGPDAVAFTVEHCGRRGAEVLVRSSPWRLGAGHTDLLGEWLTAWVGAACEQEVGLAAEAGDYTRRRLAQAAAGELRVTVDHADLLALPR